jgi:CRP-like cAMP-binding protein
MPPEGRKSLLRTARLSELPADKNLYEPGVAAEWVYFPVTAVCSLLTQLSSGERVETVTIGNEGIVGLPAFLGTLPTSYAVVQIEGMAFEVSAAHLRDCFEKLAPVRRSLLAFIAYGLDMTRQSVACNAYHGIDQRLARWLLIANDRAKAQRMPLTQDYLSSMVAASRPRVSEALNKLKQRGIVEHGRGWIEILDRTLLERHSCECYRVMVDWHRRNQK